MRSSPRPAAAAVVGIGTTPFGAFPEFSIYDLGIMALRAALDDAGMGFPDIDGLIVCRIPDYRLFGEQCGISPDYTLALPGHGRFAGAAIQTATAVIASGLARTVALVYANDGRTAGTRYGGDARAYGSAAGAYGSGPDEQWNPYGMTSPGAFHALMMQRHMHLYGTTQDQLGIVASTFRAHAAHNPDAVMRKPFTLDEYRQSRLICEPLRLLDYCLVNDGAVSMVVVSSDRATDMRQRPVYIRGTAQASAFASSTFPPDDFWYRPMRRASAEVYAMAGVVQEEMSGLMIYDNFTPTVLFTLEGFGFCGPGESGPWVQSGHLGLGGLFPTNTNGGHLSESYMQGWSLNAEAVRQIRGQCGLRQIAQPQFIQYMAAAPIVTSIIYGREVV